MYIPIATYVAKEPPPTRPDRDFRKSPENAAMIMRTVRCRMAHSVQSGPFCMGLKMPIGTFDPEERGHATMRAAGSCILLSLTVHCRSRSHRLRSPIVTESTVSSRRLLLRHNQDRRSLLAPTGIFPCPSRVPFRSTRLFKVTCTQTPHVSLLCSDTQST